MGRDAINTIVGYMFSYHVVVLQVQPDGKYVVDVDPAIDISKVSRHPPWP